MIHGAGSVATAHAARLGEKTVGLPGQSPPPWSVPVFPIDMADTARPSETLPADGLWTGDVAVIFPT